MRIRLVKEVKFGFRTSDEDVLRTEVIDEPENPPIKVVIWKNRAYEYTYKLSGEFFYREVQCLVLNNE